MIEIEEGENVALPQEYHEVHNLCAIIYDHLTEILNEENGIYADLRHTKFDVKESHKRVEDMRAEKLHALDWLALNNMNSELTTSIIKHLVNGLIYDFSSFVYESINAAKRGKLTVAYALLRKPFTDILMLFEQILVDKEEFIQRFYYQGNPDLYDPASQKIAKEDVIKSAIKKLPLSALFRKDFIYEVRYDKACNYGLNGISNKAIHIVTSQKHYKTEDQSFNFLFQGEDELNSLWKHYYTIIPYLLLYSTAVIDEIVFTFLPDEKPTKFAKAIKRTLAMLVWLGTTAQSDSTMIELISELLLHKCKMCQNEIKFQLADFRLFVSSDVMLCDNCFTNQFADPEFESKFVSIWIDHFGLAGE